MVAGVATPDGDAKKEDFDSNAPHPEYDIYEERRFSDGERH